MRPDLAKGNQLAVPHCALRSFGDRTHGSAIVHTVGIRANAPHASAVAEQVCSLKRMRATSSGSLFASLVRGSPAGSSGCLSLMPSHRSTTNNARRDSRLLSEQRPLHSSHWREVNAHSAHARCGAFCAEIAGLSHLTLPARHGYPARHGCPKRADRAHASVFTSSTGGRKTICAGCTAGIPDERRPTARAKPLLLPCSV